MYVAKLGKLYLLDMKINYLTNEMTSCEMTDDLKDACMFRNISPKVISNQWLIDFGFKFYKLDEIEVNN